jgi:hypothetical protein
MEDFNEIIFTKEECDKIISYTFNLSKTRQTKTEKRLVSFESCFLTPSIETNWIFDKLYSFLETKLNVSIVQPLENIMINRYDIGDEFEKHKDLYIKNQIYNIIVNLNEEYDGGDFKLYLPDFTLTKKTGNASIFENTRIHSVEKVTSGYRISMIAFFLRNNLKKSNKLL